ncbi:OLC1v1005580C1 [Oldenlandia corymbosa var. corymbosa]|uniref:OLC1v1005580C1 n=1 Tax=Oldenlandia corymbosa var. corymbosa TaxID=529605 RepID=A0AAV1DHW0_OLDCO|nr:OLC1v1005580C1 [Oldenlandia corymbosa var. corymbosa]
MADGDQGVEAAMGVSNRGVEVDTGGGDRVVETATAFNDRGKASIPPEWRNGDWIDDMLSSDRVISYVVDDSGLMNAECSGRKSIEQSYCASKSTQGHSSVVDQLESECGEDNSGNELGVDNMMVEEDTLHKEISYVMKNNDLAVFTLVGKTTRSEKKAYDLYNDHARLIGFSVRVGKQKFRGKTDKVRMKKFCYNREGYKKSGGNGDVCHERINFRCGCPAFIHFTVDKDDLWTCTKYLVDHNHDLVPNEMIGLLRSQREVDENDMKIIKDMTRSGIPLVDAYKFVTKLHGGSPNMKYTLRDAYNYERPGVGFEAVRGEDLRCSQGNIDSYLPGDPYLESIRRVYTVEAFREVQQLHKDGMLCRLQGLSCTCRYYSEAGMLCCHILRICHVTSVDEFPKDYICMRRTKGYGAMSSIAIEGDGKADGPLLWKALIMRRFSDLVYASEYNKDAKKCCDEAVDRLKEELGSFIGSNNNDESIDNDDLHYQSMPFPYPKGAAQDYSGSGSFGAVNASHQSMPSLNVNSGGFSFANPSVAAKDFSWAGASTSVNAFIKACHSHFQFPRGLARSFKAQALPLL